jgi:hypothetical protein
MPRYVKIYLSGKDDGCPARRWSTTRVVSVLIVSVMALVTVLAVVLASATSYEIAVDDYAVQIWQPDTASGEPGRLLAFGIVVGDGNHVLTVLDYERNIPDELLVVSPKYGTFNASIQAIDYRTSATLLRLQDANLPVAEIGNTSFLASNQSQRVYIRGWTAGTNKYTKSPADTDISDNVSPLFFTISPSQEAIAKRESWIMESGAVVTDKDGKAIGLWAIYWSSLLPLKTYGSIEIFPLVINIDSALTLLTDTSRTNGPAVCVALTESDTIDFVPGLAIHLPLNNIENLNTTIMGLLDGLGGPLPVDDIKPSFSPDLYAGFHPEEGNMLIADFTYPVELHDNDNNLLATAKWVGIQWERSEGKPNRLIYGSPAYVVEGAYSIEGNISGLVQLLEPILSEIAH